MGPTIEGKWKERWTSSRRTMTGSAKGWGVRGFKKKVLMAIGGEEKVFEARLTVTLFERKRRLGLCL